MKNIIMKKKGEAGFVTWIKKRIKNNLNFIAIAEGPTGIGKTWSMLSVAYEIDPDFEPRQVVFSFKAVMGLINDEEFKKKKWKIILFDEPQTDISNRQWQSMTNKLFNFLLSTFRHQNIILLFATPYSDFLDSQTLKLIHCKFEIKGHSRKRQITQIRPKLLQYNGKMKKFYEHSLYVITKGGTAKLIHWEVKKPPKHLVDPYEVQKNKFTSALNRKILEELNKFEEKKEKKSEPKRVLDPDSIHPVIWEEAGKGWKNQQELAERVEKASGKPMHQATISYISKQMRRKGYDIDTYRVA